MNPPATDSVSPSPRRRGLPAAALLLLLCAALYLPGIAALPPVDRDEPRFAQASKQMVEAGDYVRINVLDQSRNKKPAGIHWLHVAAVRLTGVKDAIWPYRLVSALGGTAAVLLTFAAGRRLFGPGPAFAGAAILAATPMLIVETHAAIADATLLATVAAAQLALACLYLRPAAAPGERPAATGWGIFLLFWCALGAGVLLKGPVTPLVSLTTLLGIWLLEKSRGFSPLAACRRPRLWREWWARPVSLAWARPLRPWLGVPLLLLIAAPWFIAVQVATRGAYLREALGEDFLPKLGSSQQGHGAPFGTYLAASLFFLWPFLLPVWRGAVDAWRARDTDRAARFCLAWLLPAWLLFETVSTKLPHYVLPLYPALALLAGRGLAGAGDAGARPAAAAPTRAGRLVTALLTAGWWLVGAALALLAPLAGLFLTGRLLPLTLLPAAVALAALILLRPGGGRLVRSPHAGVLFAVLYFAPLLQWVLPRFEPLWVNRQIVAMVRAYEREVGHPVTAACTGYEEMGLAFALGTRTGLELAPAQAVERLKADPAGTVALVQDAAAPLAWPGLPAALQERLNRSLALKPSRRREAEFRALAAAAGLPVRRIAQVDGFNHSKGRRVRVILYAAAGEGAAP
ncbi:MAG: glycosyltransferase family 39 protein [Lentisphaeria bacterium]|jgi:4-amino-4-deoxy-L-arabinose transferase-like glycosyltransferase